MRYQSIWDIPDCFLPALGDNDDPSHEAFCLLNPGDSSSHVLVTLFFEDRDPDELQVIVSGRRTLHLRSDTFCDRGIAIPREVPYAVRIQSTEPISVQYSRLDTSRGRSLATTIAVAIR